MYNQQRQDPLSLRILGLGVDKVDVDSVYEGLEVVELVEAGLLALPAVLGKPVLGKLTVKIYP